jgi:hypothetical protein
LTHKPSHVHFLKSSLSYHVFLFKSCQQLLRSDFLLPLFNHVCFILPHVRSRTIVIWKCHSMEQTHVTHTRIIFIS